MIEVNNLSKTFKNVSALENLSFSIQKGEILGLLGENGAGKTTTLRILSTLLKPSSGTVSINGYDVVSDAMKVRQQIGFLFGSEVSLYDRLTGRENIKYFGQLYGMSNIDLNKRIDNIIEEFGMKEYIDRRVSVLSRGMKQKIAIARSMIHSPTVILFDEPTTGLDVNSTRLIHEYVLHCKKNNKTIIFSSHSMHDVEKLCDKVLVINKGKFIEKGNVLSLKEKYNFENFENLFITLTGGVSHEGNDINSI